MAGWRAVWGGSILCFHPSLPTVWQDTKVDLFQKTWGNVSCLYSSAVIFQLSLRIPYDHFWYGFLVGKSLWQAVTLQTRFFGHRYFCDIAPFFSFFWRLFLWWTHFFIWVRFLAPAPIFSYLEKIVAPLFSTHVKIHLWFVEWFPNRNEHLKSQTPFSTSISKL